jgi:hypothetical protein
MKQAIRIFDACLEVHENGSRPGEMAAWRKEHEDAWNIASEINELRKQYG